MIEARSKPLFATVFMALTLAHAAPLLSTPQLEIVAIVPGHRATLSGHTPSTQITAPAIGEHPFSKQAKLFSDDDDKDDDKDDDNDDDDDKNALLTHKHGDGHLPCCSKGDKLAEYVISLRHHVDSMTDDEFDAFLDNFLVTASKEQMFALKLALDLDAEEDEEEEKEKEDSWDNDDDDDDDDFLLGHDADDDIKFVPYDHRLKHHHHHHHHHPHSHRHTGEELECDSSCPHCSHRQQEHQSGKGGVTVECGMDGCHLTGGDTTHDHHRESAKESYQTRQSRIPQQIQSALFNADGLIPSAIGSGSKLGTENLIPNVHGLDNDLLGSVSQTGAAPHRGFTIIKPMSLVVDPHATNGLPEIIEPIGSHTNKTTAAAILDAVASAM